MAASLAMFSSAPMMGKSLLKTIFFLSLQLAAATPSSLEQVRELIAAKKTMEAVAILKTDHARLIRSEKDSRRVTQWLSIFLYETSMEFYERAAELATTDPSGATDQFELLIEKEPFNKIALSSYIAFLIEQKKWSAANTLIEKSATQFPYFGVFSVYKTIVAQNQNEPILLRSCEKKVMAPVEMELCYLTHLVARVQVKDAKKKPTEQELKKLATKSTIPDVHYWLWSGTQNIAHLKHYVSLCRGLTEKYKKNYRIVPDLCAKMREAESQLEPKHNDETSAP